MTNYFRILIAAGVLCAACSAGEKPAAPAAKPATNVSAAKPAAAPAAAQPAAQPAAQTAAPATAAATASGATHYQQAANGGSLAFTFMQADAVNKGSFGKFLTDMIYDEKNLAGSRLTVTVQIGSLTTQDKDRDDSIKSADLLDAAKFPTARYTATSLARNAGGAIEAVGKLQLHGVTRDLRVPLQIRSTAGGIEISGQTSIKRLDYGVGQGDLKSTEWVGDEVKLQFKVPLSRTG